MSTLSAKSQKEKENESSHLGGPQCLSPSYESLLALEKEVSNLLIITP